VIATGEYELLTEAVGLLDRSERAKLLLTGSEAVEFLEGQLTNDVEALAPGGGCYAALLTHKGKMRADLRVLRGSDWVWLDAEAAARSALAQTVEMYGIGRDVRFEDLTESRAILSLIGPRAADTVGGTPPAEEHAFIEGEHGLHVRTDLGVDVICDASAAEGVRDALGVEAVSDEAAECLRIESGRPRYGIDMDSNTIPEEAGLNERAVSFTKGCYVGQETVARLHYRGKPNRRLRGLRLSAPAAQGDELLLGDRVVGTVGSTCVSPTLGPIGLAIVRREAADGANVLVGEDRHEAQVVELPFRGE
jgi:tRNA-modifying protein YgfZ